MSAQFWAMGGYAGYVWPSVAAVIAILVWNIEAARRQLSAARRRARRVIEAANKVGQ